MRPAFPQAQAAPWARRDTVPRPEEAPCGKCLVFQRFRMFVPSLSCEFWSFWGSKSRKRGVFCTERLRLGPRASEICGRQLESLAVILPRV
jgi:hypothetical protein